jgi:hypothetical protein
LNTGVQGNVLHPSFLSAGFTSQINNLSLSLKS